MKNFIIDVGISLKHYSVEDAFSIIRELHYKLAKIYQTEYSNLITEIEKDQPHGFGGGFAPACGYHDVRFEFETNEAALKAYDFINFIMNQKGIILGNIDDNLSYVTKPYLEI